MESTIEFNIATEQILTENHPQEKTGCPIRTGFNTDSIVSPKKILQTTYHGKVRNYNVDFNLSISAFVNGDYVCKETFVLEIEARTSQERHTASLPMGGFNSHLYADYALAYDNIAKQFCAINKLILNDERNHWPVLQYIVSIPQ